MKPFYLDENLILKFPKREIYHTQPHEVWFKDEDIPLLGVIRGYFFDDHILVFVNDYNIPPLHPTIIMDWFNSYSSLNYVKLGANLVNGEYIAKLVMFRGETVRFRSIDSSEEDQNEKSLIEESNDLSLKSKIGFCENNSNK
jgi:hypothetical protein